MICFGKMKGFCLSSPKKSSSKNGVSILALMDDAMAIARREMVDRRKKCGEAALIPYLSPCRMLMGSGHVCGMVV